MRAAPNTHNGATVAQQAQAQPRKTRNRPFDAGVSPRIARSEAFVEAIVALSGCASLERRAGTVLAYNERTRCQLEAQYSRSEISFETFHRQSFALDKIETRLAVELIKNAASLRRAVIPEVQRGYERAEAA